jgi:hypothetical protein
MKFHDSKMFRWIFSTPYRALHRAYEASKKVRNIQRDYLFYKNAVGDSSKRSFYNVTLYIDNILNQAASNIFWSLLEFKISILFCNFIAQFNPNVIFEFNNPTKESLNNLYDGQNTKVRSTFQEQNTLRPRRVSSGQWPVGPPIGGVPPQGRESRMEQNTLNIYTRSLKQKSDNLIQHLFKWTKKKIEDDYSDNLAFTSSLQKNCYFLSKFYNKKLDWERLNRKLTWIEAVLIDLEVLKNKGWFQSPVLNRRYSNFYQTSLFPSSWTSKLKDTAYESLGLVPRSITRTLSRFQTELAGRSASLVLPEFRLAKYQAIASLNYLAFLILCPWVVLFVCKILFLEPLIENWWNTSQFQIFLSFSQEEKALKRLQQVEELLWLDIIMADSSAKQPQDLSAQIHQKTIDLVETYNQESIQTIVHFFTNFVFIVVIISLLIWGKKRLAILNSWVQEVFYSLSDTMKAFFILLFTDLCIGFHSPHGWEILIGFLLEHLGFSHNKHVISCFVSTFPVILDTVFKYWIFRHLNRISPSIVVSYHTMNE